MTVRDRIKHFNVCKLNTEAASSDTLRYINKLCHEEKAFTCLLAPKAQLKLSFTMFRVFRVHEKSPKSKRCNLWYWLMERYIKANLICNVDLNKPIIAVMKRSPKIPPRAHLMFEALSHELFPFVPSNHIMMSHFTEITNSKDHHFRAIKRRQGKSIHQHW